MRPLPLRRRNRRRLNHCARWPILVGGRLCLKLMHEAIFSQAAKPETAVVLFLPLKPYSCGHEIELWRQNNPLLTGTLAEFEKLPTVEQLNWLIKAVDFCSQNHDEWLENEDILRSNPSFWSRKVRKNNTPK